MMKALALPELQKRFIDAGVVAAPVSPAEFMKFAAAETATWKKVVQASGAKVE
jgi:tripartite-type tricarboxylate transporter receptor subunit TctC